MTRPRSAMRKIREILRLSLAEGLSRRQVGTALQMPYTTVADHLRRARAAGLSWPLPEDIDDAELEARLFSPAVVLSPGRETPPWADLHRELRRPGVTLQLLWMEYKERSPGRLSVQPVLRSVPALAASRSTSFAPGAQGRREDASSTSPARPSRSSMNRPGRLRPRSSSWRCWAQATTRYAELSPSQELRDWIAAHVHAFEYFGGCPRIIVPDNLQARHPCPPLRARLKPHLRGDGHPLRGRRHPGPTR